MRSLRRKSIESTRLLPSGGCPTCYCNLRDKFICKLTGQKMDVDDPKVNYTCKTDYGEDYKNCDAYQHS